MRKVKIVRGSQDIVHDRLRMKDYDKEFNLITETKYVSVVSDGEREYTFKNEFIIKQKIVGEVINDTIYYGSLDIYN